MKSAHADMDIPKGPFNALVEVLQSAMDAQGNPFAQQSRPLALLISMDCGVITKRSNDEKYYCFYSCLRFICKR